MLLIVGASGRLGRATARLLLDAGAPVRVMSRDPARVADLGAAGAEVVRGDLRTPASLVHACRGVSAVLAAAHSFMGRGSNSSPHVDDAGNRALIDAAEMAGARRFVFVSALGARPDHPVDFFRTKYQVEQYLRQHAPEWVILRPTAFMETWAEFIGDQVRTRGTAAIFGNGTNPINFVSADDVAHFAVMALQRSDARGRIVEIGGPENRTLLDVMDIYARVVGRSARPKHIPVPVMRGFGTLLRRIDPVRSRMMTAGALMATEDQTFDMTDVLREYPMKLTRLEDYVRTHAATPHH